MKKFLCLTAARGIGVRQRWLFCESSQAIRNTDRNDEKRNLRAERSFAPSRAFRTELAASPSRRSEPELVLEQVVDGLRIGLAARRLHHLADEPAGQLRLRLHLG